MCAWRFLTFVLAEEISVTESETDNEESANQLASKSLVHTRNDANSSDTESDSEDENDLRAVRHNAALCN